MNQPNREGLTDAEAQKRLSQHGYNEIQEEKASFARNVIEKLWGPIPWILEAALLLEVAFGKVAEPIIIAILLLFSAMFGFIATGFFITPLLSIVLIIVMNDIVTMTVATDRAGVSSNPEQWNMKEIAKFSTLLGFGWIVLGFGLLLVFWKMFHMPMPQIQTLMFAYLIYSAQITIYLTRVRGRFWTLAPSGFVALATGGNVILASIFSYFGILMQPIPLSFLAGTFGAVLAMAYLLDEIKVRVFQKV